MTFILIPTLQHFAAVRIATELITKCKFTDIDIPYESRLKLPGHMFKQQMLVKKSLENVGRISLPKELVTFVEDAVKAIGSQIRHIEKLCFHLFCERHDFDVKTYVSNMSLTTFGTIRKKESFESYLTVVNMNLQAHYRLACQYVCENLIPVLWERMSSWEKEIFVERHEGIDKYQLVEFTNYLPEEELLFVIRDISEANHHESLSISLVKASLAEHNDIAFAYYWTKLNEVEKSIYVTTCAQYELIYRMGRFDENNSNILLLLISKMDPTDLISLVAEFPYQFISYLLDGWMKQKFVLPLVENAWNLFSEEQHLDLVSKIVHEIGNVDVAIENRYQKMFAELWPHVPDSLKKRISKQPVKFFEKFLAGNDLESLKLVLDEMTVEDRKETVYLHTILPYHKRLIRRDNLDVLLGYLRYSSLSETEILVIVRDIVFENESELCFEMMFALKWELLNKILNVIFVCETEMNDFKSQLIYSRGKTICTRFVEKLSPDLIDKFLDWGFSTKEEGADFKRKILFSIEPAKKEKSLLIQMLIRGQVKFVEKFVRECFSSDVEICQLKMTLMMSEEMIVSYIHLINDSELRYYTRSDDKSLDDRWSLISEIIDWFNLSRTQLDQFLLRFREYVEDWRVYEVFCMLIDDKMETESLQARFINDFFCFN